MSVVAPETLRKRAREHAASNPEATLPEVLGYFQLDPAESSDERALVEDVLTAVEQPDPDPGPEARDADEQGGASA